jgi:AraC family transcriptional regulator of adaptative response/methylated-DNA-[protein]-cysteine methyltransferase
MDSSLKERVFSSPLGDLRALADDAGLALLDFHDRRSVDTQRARVEKACAKGGREPWITVPTVPRASALRGSGLRDADEHLGSAEAWLNWYFTDGSASTEPIVTLAPFGTPFQKRAWLALLDIPRGLTRSYLQQAIALDTPSGVRAVARANGANYLGLIVPCHRVIGSDGSLTGYGGGLHRKRWLIDHEAASSEGLFKSHPANKARATGHATSLAAR